MSDSGRLTLNIIAPDRKHPMRKADFVILPATEGEIGIMPRHIQLVTSLRAGVITYVSEAARTSSRGTDRRYIAISGGFAEISDDVVTVLADTAESSEEIDVERAREAYERAQRRLKADDTELDGLRARTALERSIARLKAAGALEGVQGSKR